MTNETPAPTIGILFPGEMGSALATFLLQNGRRVVGTIAERGARTRNLAVATGMELLPTLPAVVGEADVLISTVTPGAALSVAQEICQHRPSAGKLFIDANSIAPRTAEQIAALCREANVDFVDMAIRGLASQLADRGAVYLSGAQASRVESLLQPLEVENLGPDPGAASRLKIMMSGMSKGVAAQFIELSLAAHQAGMLPRFLAGVGRYYPDILAAMRSVLPTYPQHAGRRAEELAEVEASLRDLRLRSEVIAGGKRLLESVAAGNLRQQAEALRDASLEEVIAAIARQHPLQIQDSPPPDATPNSRSASSPNSEPAPMKKADAMSNKLRSATLNPGPGFRIRLDFPRLSPMLYKQLLRFETPDISDMLNRLFALDSQIHCLTGDHHRICGPVSTVKVFPGDNLMVHKVLDVAQPGDIVAIDACGSRMNAVIGDIICTKARHRGIQGFIVDGLIRDLPGIRDLDFPVFARGETAIGPLHRGPGEINYPIACGGTVINPGDIIVADAAGIVAAPQDIVGELIRRLKAHEASSREYLESVQRGEFSNAWVDGLLAELNCTITGALPNASSAAPLNGGSQPASADSATMES